MEFDKTVHKGVGYLRTGENFLSVIRIEKKMGNLVNSLKYS